MAPKPDRTTWSEEELLEEYRATIPVQVEAIKKRLEERLEAIVQREFQAMKKDAAQRAAEAGIEKQPMSQAAEALMLEALRSVIGSLRRRPSDRFESEEYTPRVPLRKKA